MKLRHSYLFVFVAVSFSMLMEITVVGGDAANLPELYWLSVLPNVSMPRTLRELLHPKYEEEKTTRVSVGNGGVHVNTGTGPRGGTSVNVGKSGVGVRTGSPGSGTNVGVGKGGVSVNAGRSGSSTRVGVGKGGVSVKGGPPGRGTSVGVGKGGVSVSTGAPGRGTNVGVGKGGVSVSAGRPGRGTRVGVGKGGVSVRSGSVRKPVVVHIGPGRVPFFYQYAATETQLHDDPDVALFFLEKDLRKRNSFNLHFTASSNHAPFLPRQEANSIPFSSNKLHEIYNKLSLNAGSPEADMMRNTLEECESPGITGEESYCATSLESMIDFTTSKLGKKVKAFATEVQRRTIKQNYRVNEMVKRMSGQKFIVCHKQNYAYAVFYCHTSGTTRIYEVPLRGEDDTRVNALAACHTNTTSWNPKHVAFQVLNVLPGEVPICHFLPEEHIVWARDQIA